MHIEQYQCTLDNTNTLSMGGESYICSVSKSSSDLVLMGLSVNSGKDHCDRLTNCMLQTLLPNLNTSDKIVQRLYRDNLQQV